MAEPGIVSKYPARDQDVEAYWFVRLQSADHRYLIPRLPSLAEEIQKSDANCQGVAQAMERSVMLKQNPGDKLALLYLLDRVSRSAPEKWIPLFTPKVLSLVTSSLQMLKPNQSKLASGFIELIKAWKAEGLYPPQKVASLVDGLRSKLLHLRSCATDGESLAALEKCLASIDTPYVSQDPHSLAPTPLLLYFAQCAPPPVPSAIGRPAPPAYRPAEAQPRANSVVQHMAGGQHSGAPAPPPVPTMHDRRSPGNMPRVSWSEATSQPITGGHMTSAATFASQGHGMPDVKPSVPKPPPPPYQPNTSAMGPPSSKQSREKRVYPDPEPDAEAPLAKKSQAAAGRRPPMAKRAAPDTPQGIINSLRAAPPRGPNGSLPPPSKAPGAHDSGYSHTPQLISSQQAQPSSQPAAPKRSIQIQPYQPVPKMQAAQSPHNSQASHGSMPPPQPLGPAPSKSATTPLPSDSSQGAAHRMPPTAAQPTEKVQAPLSEQDQEKECIKLLCHVDLQRATTVTQIADGLAKQLNKQQVIFRAITQAWQLQKTSASQVGILQLIDRMCNSPTGGWTTLFETCIIHLLCSTFEAALGAEDAAAVASCIDLLGRWGRHHKFPHGTLSAIAQRLQTRLDVEHHKLRSETPSPAAVVRRRVIDGYTEALALVSQPLVAPPAVDLHAQAQSVIQNMRHPTRFDSTPHPPGGPPLQMPSFAPPPIPLPTPPPLPNPNFNNPMFLGPTFPQPPLPLPPTAAPQLSLPSPPMLGTPLPPSLISPAVPGISQGVAMMPYGPPPYAQDSKVPADVLSRGMSSISSSPPAPVSSGISVPPPPAAPQPVGPTTTQRHAEMENILNELGIGVQVSTLTGVQLKELQDVWETIDQMSPHGLKLGRLIILLNEELSSLDAGGPSPVSATAAVPVPLDVHSGPSFQMAPLPPGAAQHTPKLPPGTPIPKQNFPPAPSSQYTTPNAKLHDQPRPTFAPAPTVAQVPPSSSVRPPLLPPPPLPPLLSTGPILPPPTPTTISTAPPTLPPLPPGPPPMVSPAQSSLPSPLAPPPNSSTSQQPISRMEQPPSSAPLGVASSANTIPPPFPMNPTLPTNPTSQVPPPPSGNLVPQSPVRTAAHAPIQTTTTTTGSQRHQGQTPPPVPPTPPPSRSSSQLAASVPNVFVDSNSNSRQTSKEHRGVAGSALNSTSLDQGAQVRTALLDFGFSFDGIDVPQEELALLLDLLRAARDGRATAEEQKDLETFHQLFKEAAADKLEPKPVPSPPPPVPPQVTDAVLSAIPSVLQQLKTAPLPVPPPPPAPATSSTAVSSSFRDSSEQGPSVLAMLQGLGLDTSPTELRKLQQRLLEFQRNDPIQGSSPQTQALLEMLKEALEFSPSTEALPPSKPKPARLTSSGTERPAGLSAAQLVALKGSTSNVERNAPHLQRILSHLSKRRRRQYNPREGRPHPIVEALYSSPNQCARCGYRLPTADSLASHIAAHDSLRAVRGKMKSRPWHPTARDWLTLI